MNKELKDKMEQLKTPKELRFSNDYNLGIEVGFKVCDEIYNIKIKELEEQIDNLYNDMREEGDRNE